ncbi:hypothetical protein [Streptomyces sp. NPDC050263]|uniref:Rv1733c family protein n=1 Tax=Streptomyces sp. NPDC050263 TaxID=3155037 RepID=UPI0034405DF1
MLVADARGGPSASAADDDRVWATVRWATADGSTRSGQVKVGSDALAGAQVTVWTDEGGHVLSKPVTHEEARFQAVVAGALAGLIAAGAVVGVALVGRACLERWRMAQWGAE